MEIKFYENKDKSIMCPYCHKFLAKADKDDPNIHKKACKNCHKWIWFKPNNDDYKKILEIPERTTSSGKRFY